MLWKIRNKNCDLSKTKLMGILNITPDSFSDGGMWMDPQEAVCEGLRMFEAGAEVVDLGAESTRPDAEPVADEEELGRILPVLKSLRSQTRGFLSIDTTKPSVAQRCLEEGADIINDVSGLRDSARAMADVVKSFSAGLVVMHRRGDPRSMKGQNCYQDLIGEVVSELRESVHTALDAGVSRSQIVVDPGIGFAKDAAQSLEMIRRIDAFKTLGFPVLVGASRKSFMGEVTGRAVGEREFATAAVTAFLVIKKIPILRVHNVSAMRDVVEIIESLGGE